MATQPEPSWVPVLVSIVSAAAALMACAVSWWQAIKSARNAESSRETAMSSLERILRSAIDDRQIAIRDISFRIADEKAAGEVSEISSQAFKAAIESYLNAHESAALYYWDGQINPDRYKAEYRQEIKNLCDSEKGHFSRLLHPEDQSDYTYIWKVYRIFWRGQINT